MKMRRIFFLSMTLVIGIVHPATADHAAGVVNPLLGGIVGGVLGSMIGSGSGRRIATGLGAATGAMYGHEATQREHEHARRIRRGAQVPHALHAPTPRIRKQAMTLNCRIAEYQGTTPMYVCQENVE